MEYGLKPLGREKLWLWIMLAPTLIGLVFGALGSILATLGLSLMNWDLLTPPTWAGATNYINLFKNPAYFKALTNTFKFSALYVPGVVVVSLFVAVLMNRKIRGVSVFRTIYFLPAVTSAVATALIWNLIYGRDIGILNYLLSRLWVAGSLLAVRQERNAGGGGGQYLGRGRRGHDHLPGRAHRDSTRIL